MSWSHEQQAQIRPNGEIIWPIAGTIRWVQGKAKGVWGKDIKIKPLLMTKDGTVRDLNALERILYAKEIKEDCL
ncbi:hypothetical protein C1J03_03120 [Sulfitobacter sp. SK012]|uniref:hypothetical protein n=1 Tax=Sulfitobacter sp. SK012 TaxID=1389005 RepID=UPI000E0BDE6C|nr:hypothetical protein [Sulfitobacter sp. SK012]AXI45114.1 hypothetical protein C1J03_03120 [Sulfitobacter sp. SK012]